MFGGNNSNLAFPYVIEDNRYANPPIPQLQLFGNRPVGCTIDPVNYFGNEQHSSSIIHPNKCVIEAEDLSKQHKLQISLNYNVFQDEVDQSPNILNQNPVSTGLRLSYDDDEHNSSVTSACRSMGAYPSVILSLGDNIRSELERQKEEFDQYVKIQEQQLAKGIRDLKRRHMASFLNTIEESVSKKLREKETELDNMNRKNAELMERIKEVTTEAQAWHYRAQCNEKMINILKSNLQNAISQSVVNQGKEGFGDSEVDDATSYIDPANYLSTGKSVSRDNYEHLTCKVCRSREVSILLTTCRHLCVCKYCDGLINACPVCGIPKRSAGVEVYLS